MGIEETLLGSNAVKTYLSMFSQHNWGKVSKATLLLGVEVLRVLGAGDIRKFSSKDIEDIVGRFHPRITAAVGIVSDPQGFKNAFGGQGSSKKHSDRHHHKQEDSLRKTDSMKELNDRKKKKPKKHHKKNRHTSPEYAETSQADETFGEQSELQSSAKKHPQKKNRPPRTAPAEDKKMD